MDTMPSYALAQDYHKTNTKNKAKNVKIAMCRRVCFIKERRGHDSKF